ncbi:MAG: RCKP-type rubredoxin-like domain-containing protein [bacterium]
MSEAERRTNTQRILSTDLTKKREMREVIEMATWKCAECGWTYEGRCKPGKCKKCGAPREELQKQEKKYFHSAQ